jgi:GNAT superfamily N-acetyltransferase
MLELNPHQYESVTPLLANLPQAVLPHAICQGINPGRVFVDRRADPQQALIWSPVGYYFLAGELASQADLADIAQALGEIFIPASKAGGESSLILVASNLAWKEKLPVLLPGREVIEIYRRPFTLDLARFAALSDWRQRVPAGFRMQPLDATLAEGAGVLASWASLDDFLANGLGFALLEGEDIASICTSVFASRQRVEIDVHTREIYRRRGLALLTAAALIEACLHQGRQPNWECFWENEPSIYLAGRLGFSPLPDYPVYYWEE